MHTCVAQTRRNLIAILAVVAAVAIVSPPRLAAQTLWNKIKQQAKQAGQQQPQQAPQQQTAPQQQSAAQPAKPAYQTAAASGTSAGSEPDSGCCTAQAMKTMAAQAGPVDMVGIKLGMTPQQATAAIKAHNPGLTVYQVNMRVYEPGQKNYRPVPHYIVGCNNCAPAKNLQVGAEVIVLEFTTPPNSPVLAMASRYTNFEPTLAGNLVNELDKKYGPEYPRSGFRTWVFDSTGKPVTTPSRVIDGCAAVMYGPLGGQPQFVQGGYPQQGNESGSLELTNYPNGKSGGAGPNPACMPYTVVQAMGVSTVQGPNTQVTNVTVTMTNGGLNYAAARSSYEWLQSEADAQAKTAHDAAAHRTGTTF